MERLGEENGRNAGAGFVLNETVGMAIPKRLRSRTGWTIGRAVILLSAWFVIPAIGQQVAVTNRCGRCASTS
jgi:hypothetical protein